MTRTATRIGTDPRWDALVASGPFHIALCRPGGDMVFLPRLGPSLGLADRYIAELLPPGDGPELGELLERVLSDGLPRSVELPARLADQSSARFEVSLLPVRGEVGTEAVLLVARDITESSRTALELRMSVNALHRAIEWREQLEADLHDGILQSLYGVGMRLEAARAALLEPEGEAAAHLKQAVEQISATMDEIRRYIAEGPGATPLAARWDETLAGVVRSLEVAGGPVIELDLDASAVTRVPATARTEVVFIAREAVCNAVRHARATRIAVRLAADAQRVRLDVEDDGEGLPEERRAGFGLLTMGRRAAQIGGALGLHSRPGQGTLVRLDIPAGEARSGD